MIGLNKIYCYITLHPSKWPKAAVNSSDLVTAIAKCQRTRQRCEIKEDRTELWEY